MEALGIMGFIFGIGALGQVLQLKKTIETLKKEVDELKKILDTWKSTVYLRGLEIAELREEDMPVM